jgi:hypothetical protein
VELGYTLYFLFVFGFGGALVIALAAYLGWLIIHRHRIPWSNRTRRARVVTVVLGLIFACLLFIPFRMLWVTRMGAIPGSYVSEGVWGTATLTMHPDGTFVEEWKFKNEYSGKPEGQGVIHGNWRDEGRDWLTRDIDLTSFKGLAEYERDHVPGNRGGNVLGYGGVTSLEVDAGSDIIFRK